MTDTNDCCTNDSNDCCKDDSAARDRGKVIKHHKLSARMALLSKGGQKSNTFMQQKLSIETNEEKSKIENVDIVTSDYDSCFETEPEIECVGVPEAVKSGCVGGCDCVRRVECDYNDTDSGVIENATGLFIGTDLEDLMEVDLTEGIADCNTTAVRDQARVAAMVDSLDEKIDVHSLPKAAIDMLKMIPDGYVPLPHQVGGHRHIEGKLGFLRKVGRNDIIYKPVQYGTKGNREVNFYDMIFKSDVSLLSHDLRGLKTLIPKYRGLKHINDQSGDIGSYMKLEDISSRFKKPCIMDIKIGKRVWDDFAEQDKIQRELKKFPAQETLGFRIIGMRVYRGSDYVYFSKEFGRSVTVDTALDSLREFFFDGSGIRNDVISNLIGQLTKCRKWVESQTSFKLFATSLLIVYEGDTTMSHDQLLDVRLVDFAHAYSQDSSTTKTDENFLFGLKNFISHVGAVA